MSPHVESLGREPSRPVTRHTHVMARMIRLPWGLNNSNFRGPVGRVLSVMAASWGDGLGGAHRGGSQGVQLAA